MLKLDDQPRILAQPRFEEKKKGGEERREEEERGETRGEEWRSEDGIKLYL